MRARMFMMFMMMQYSILDSKEMLLYTHTKTHTLTHTHVYINKMNHGHCRLSHPPLPSPASSTDGVQSQPPLFQ